MTILFPTKDKECKLGQERAADECGPQDNHYCNLKMIVIKIIIIEPNAPIKITSRRLILKIASRHLSEQTASCVDNLLSNSFVFIIHLH